MVEIMTVAVATAADPELVPDSDLDLDHGPEGENMPRDERLKLEAKSQKHLFCHRPKNPFCPTCQKAKMMAPYARKTGGSSTVRSEAYGDHVTMDHIIARDLRDYGFDDQRVALVVKDVFSKFRYVYPSDTKEGEQVLEDLLHFVGVDDDIKVMYSDNAPELIDGVKQLDRRIRHVTSREYANQNKSVAEREIRTVLEGTRANLVQSGLPEKFWPLAAQHHAMALNLTKRVDADANPGGWRPGGNDPNGGDPPGDGTDTVDVANVTVPPFPKVLNLDAWKAATATNALAACADPHQEDWVRWLSEAYKPFPDIEKLNDSGEVRFARSIHEAWKNECMDRRRIKSANQGGNKAYDIALPCVVVNRVLCGKSKGPACSTYGQHSGGEVHCCSRACPEVRVDYVPRSEGCAMAGGGYTPWQTSFDEGDPLPGHSSTMPPPGPRPPRGSRVQPPGPP